MFGRDIVGVLVRTAEIELSDAKKPVNIGKAVRCFDSGELRIVDRQPDSRVAPRRKVVFYGLATVTPSSRPS